MSRSSRTSFERRRKTILKVVCASDGTERSLTHVPIQPVVNEFRRNQVVLFGWNPVGVAMDAARFESEGRVHDTRLREILGSAVVVRRVIGRLAGDDNNRDTAQVR